MRLRLSIDENERTLRRIVALLLALADLADRAAGRSRVVCLLVLWFLRPAEAVGRAYLDGLASCATLPPAAEPPWRCAHRAHDCAAEALSLAACFRALALSLAAFLPDAPAAWRAAPDGGLAPALRSLSLVLATAAGPVAAGRLDTS